MNNDWPIQVRSDSLRSTVIVALSCIPKAGQRTVLNRLASISDAFPFGPGAEERAITIWRSEGCYIFLNPLHLERYDLAERTRVVVHELAHVFCGLTNDIVRDEQNADRLAGMWGYPRNRPANWQSIRRSNNYDKMDETIRGLRQIGREAKNSD